MRITFQQVASDVVETGSGALDLDDLDVGTFGIARNAEVDTVRGRVFSGAFTDANAAFADLPQALITFGPGSFTAASVTTGGPVGFQSGVADLTTLIFPAGYISDTPLSDSSTYLGATINSLGLTPGEYVVDRGSDAQADSLTIDVIGPPPAVPEPSTWAMMLIGFAGLGYAASRRKGALRASAMGARVGDHDAAAGAGRDEASQPVKRSVARDQASRTRWPRLRRGSAHGRPSRNFWLTDQITLARGADGRPAREKRQKS
jgi:PEP-CTERM motif